MFCSNCGNKLSADADVCMKCGKYVKKEQNTTVNQSNEGTFGWGVLGFFIPLVGLILFITWKTDHPARSKAAGIGALIGFGIQFIFGIIFGIIFSTYSTQVIDYGFLDYI